MTFLADPCGWAEADGTLQLLAERLDHRDGKGEIWSACVPPGGDPAQAVFRPAIRAATHLSYPFVFPLDGLPHLVAESWEAWRTTIHRREPYGTWRPVGQILEGIPVVDPTIYRDPAGSRWWLFCGREDDRPNRNLYLFHATHPLGPWTAHAANPVKSSLRSSRPAGALILAGERLLRPAQDCSATYGGAVTVNRIERLTPTEFREVEERHIPPPPGPYADGLHTLCGLGRWTILDGKRWRTHPLEPLRQWRVGRMSRRRRQAAMLS